MTFNDYLYELTDNRKYGLERAKENALALYKLAKSRFLEVQTEEMRADFLEAKKVCMFLGVRI